MSSQNPFAKLDSIKGAIALEESYDREIARLRENRERLGQRLKTQAQERRERMRRQNAER